MKLSIVIPIYNEEKTLTTIIDKVLATPYDKEIILIDDFLVVWGRHVIVLLPR